MVLVFIFGDHGLLQLYKLKKEKTKFKTTYLISEEKEKLVSEKHRLENDIDYIEKLAREKYRMAKPGEKCLKLSIAIKNKQVMNVKFYDVSST